MNSLMRVICVLWLTLLLPVPGATGDPGDTALRFLEKVRDQKLNLEPGGDTALGPQTRDPKRREIARRLERMARELDDTPLEIGEIKLDGELAAVLVRKSGGLDPNRMRVFPVALIREASGWKPAPLPASFENTGLGYTPPIRRRIEALQEWMLRGQVTDLARLREQSARKIRENIEKSLPVETLRGLDSQQTAERFISACGGRNLPEILGLLGGLSTPPPDDWTLRLSAAEKALATAATPRPWRQLVAHDVLRATVHHEEDGDTALVSVACLDPSGSSPRATVPKIEFLHLELVKSPDGFWRIDLPENFLNDPSEPDPFGDDSMDQELLDAFNRKLAEAYPPAPRPDARQAAQDLAECLQRGDLRDLVRLIAPSPDSGKARENLLRAAQVWWTLHDPTTSHRLVGLAIREQDDHAVALGQFFSTRNPDRFDLRTLHFSKSADGWLWTPLPDAGSNAKLDEWTREETQRRQQSWQDDLLAECLEIAVLPETGAPSEAEARALVESWLKAAREGDVEAALRHCARLNKPDSKTTVLRNLGYEITGLQRASRLPAITAVQREGSWSTVAVDSLSDDNPTFPLYPVIQTSAGPRILIEVDLIASTSRSREFLNRAALDRLQDLSPAAANVLKRLFATHKTARDPAQER
jgi:hypothetical protein